MKVFLKHNGIFVDNIKINNIYHYLDYKLEIIGQVNVENLFDTLILMENDVNKFSEEYLGGFDIRPFYDELKKGVDDKSKIHNLVIHKRKETFDFETDIYYDVTGYSLEDDDGYGISLSSLNNIKHCLLEISNETDVINYDDAYSQTKEKNDGITLKEFLNAFLGEITFHGYPNNKEIVIDELVSISEEIDNGNMKTFTLDEIKLSMYEEMKQKYIDKEDYENAALVQKKIDELDL
jgi:hypothetical protein